MHRDKSRDIEKFIQNHNNIECRSKFTLNRNIYQTAIKLYRYTIEILSNEHRILLFQISVEILLKLGLAIRVFMSCSCRHDYTKTQTRHDY